MKRKKYIAKTFFLCQVNKWLANDAGASIVIFSVSSNKMYKIGQKVLDIKIITAMFQVKYEQSLGLQTSNLPREKWDTWDPTLISEVGIL